jgi:hypothetical protein
MSPSAKKFLSAVLVAVASAVIGVLQTYVVHLSPEIVAVAAPLLVGAAHYVNALGHAERVEAVANEKAATMLTEVINGERS